MSREDPSHPDIAIEIAPKARNLGILRHFICSLANDLKLSCEESLQLEMCVDEACANSIESVCKKEGENALSCVRIEIMIKSKEIHVIIKDSGNDFSSALNKAKPLHDFTDRTKRRGYGLQIIKTFMDVVDYKYDPQGGNKLHLVKFFSHATE